MRLLLQHGASIADASDREDSALVTAMRFAHTSIVRLLLVTGADANQADDEGWTPMHYIPGIEGSVQARIASELLAAGADVNRTTQAGHTPLHLAAGWPHPEPGFIQLLLASGAPVDQPAADGATPLHFRSGEE